VKATASASDYQLKLSLADDAALMDIRYSQQNRTFSVDGKQIQLEPNDSPTIHLYVDGSVLEVILGERIGFTKRFYFSQTTAPNVNVLLLGNNATNLEGWNIRPISNDRLTT
jgi:beta-fructofuranosidase